MQAGSGEGTGDPLQYSCLENPMDGEAWWATVHGVAKSRTRLSDLTFTFHFHALEKEMATHSSVLAWRIPGTGEPGGLPAMGSHRVGHDWSDLAAAAAVLGCSFPVHIMLSYFIPGFSYFSIILLTSFTLGFVFLGFFFFFFEINVLFLSIKYLSPKSGKYSKIQKKIKIIPLSFQG